jgi:hypothetical protein
MLGVRLCVMLMQLASLFDVWRFYVMLGVFV